jgi:hypothetical protein
MKLLGITEFCPSFSIDADNILRSREFREVVIRA